MTDQPKNSRVKAWQIILGGIILLILIGLAIPNVRASISSWMGLSVAPSSTVTIVPVTLEAISTSSSPVAAAVTQSPSAPVGSTPMGTQKIILPVVQQAAATQAPSAPVGLTPLVTQNINLPAVQSAPTNLGSIDLSQLGWKVLTPSYLPEGYQYQSAYFDTNNKMLVLTYLVTRPLPGATDPTLTSSETITLLQAQSNNFVPMQVAPDTAIQEVQVNGAPAVFTTGGWDTQYVKDNNAPGGGKMVSSWRNDLAVKNLYWQVGDIYLLLVTPDGVVTQQNLVDMASSMGK